VEYQCGFERHHPVETPAKRKSSRAVGDESAGAELLHPAATSRWSPVRSCSSDHRFRKIRNCRSRRGSRTRRASGRTSCSGRGACAAETSSAATNVPGGGPAVQPAHSGDDRQKEQASMIGDDTRRRPPSRTAEHDTPGAARTAGAPFPRREASRGWRPGQNMYGHSGTTGRTCVGFETRPPIRPPAAGPCRSGGQQRALVTARAPGSVRRARSSP